MITAGFPRQPGMSRMDLLGKNAAIMSDVIAKVTPGSPNAILIVVSNPLDEMTFLAAERVRVPEGAGRRDGGRPRLRAAAVLHRRGARRLDDGGRGDDARLARRRDGRPARATRPSTASPLPELVDEATLERLFQRTRDGGAEIVALLKTGSRVLRAERVGRRDGRGHRRATRRRCCRSAPGRRGSTGSATSTSACRPSSAAAASRRSSSSTSTTTSSAKLRAAAEGIREKCADLAKL